MLTTLAEYAIRGTFGALFYPLLFVIEVCTPYLAAFWFFLSSTMAESVTDPLQNERDIIKEFRKCWTISTADDNLTLHGFLRFKTTHLLNLRFLENEITHMDHTLYQAGLGLGLETSSTDRLSNLKHITLIQSVG
jgi:hypothetical protein